MITAVASPPALAVSPRHRTLAASRTQTSVRIGTALVGILVFVNDAVFRRADVEHPSFDWQIALRLVVCGACGLYGLAHLRRSLPTLTRGAGLLVTAFGCWTVLILPFSADPTYSAISVASLWCVILFTAAVKHEVPAKPFILTVVLSLVLFGIGSWLVFYCVPPLGQEVQDIGGNVTVVRFGGLQHPTGLGRQCALCVAMMLVVGLKRYARWKTLSVPMAFIMITGAHTESRTSVLAMAAVVFVAFFRSLPVRKVAIGVLVLGPMAVAVAGLGMSTGFMNLKAERMAEKLSRDGDSSEVYTLNSRTQVWDYALEKFWESPIVGYGQGCQRFVMKDNFFPTHHAHNLLLNVALGTGLFGAGLLVLQIIVLGKRFFSGADLFGSLLLVTVLIFGMTDSVMLSPIPDSHTFLWWLAIFCPKGLSSLPASLAENP